MTSKEKELARPKNNPTNISFDQLSRILTDAGFSMRRPRGGSSHATFSKGEWRLTVPYARPLDPVYVRRALEIIALSREEQKK